MSTERMITMITIKTTPNFYGISLQGDYLDLNELYDSISRYLELYMKTTNSIPITSMNICSP